ncbi:MAG: hypothetical protein KDK89_07045 [Alphaproteobacteria bacterium]|nr:hypothetical protein [Alphaproteobacteria bacterium]
MRFIHVIFLALWQLTAIPFIALISANSINVEQHAAASENNTVIYKTSAASIDSQTMHN